MIPKAVAAAVLHSERAQTERLSVCLLIWTPAPRTNFLPTVGLASCRRRGKGTPDGINHNSMDEH